MLVVHGLSLAIIIHVCCGLLAHVHTRLQYRMRIITLEIIFDATASDVIVVFTFIGSALDKCWSHEI